MLLVLALFCRRSAGRRGQRPAGGGLLFTFPALVALGPPVAANATANIASWPGLRLGGVRHAPRAGPRRRAAPAADLRRSRRRHWRGVARVMSAQVFSYLVPWLLLLARCCSGRAARCWPGWAATTTPSTAAGWRWAAGWSACMAGFLAAAWA